MAATNQSQESGSDKRINIAEQSMTGQELLQQIATMVGHDNMIMATSPIDTSMKSEITAIELTKKNIKETTTENETTTALKKLDSPPPPPPVVYGELSILGYNGYIPSNERNGRRNKSKFLLCKRPTPNGIRKSEHYFVKQPQATKAIQDKDNYSISYTFSKTQTIIVEYKQHDKTDLFQIGRSSEDPIDFVVMDTVPAKDSSDKHHNSSNKHSSVASHSRHSYTHGANQNYSDNPSSSHQAQQPFDLVEMTRFHRHLAKVEEEMMRRGIPPYPFDPCNRFPPSMYGNINGHPQPMPMNYSPPNLSNLPPLMAEHFRRQELSLFNVPHHPIPGGSHHSNYHQPNELAHGINSSSHDNRQSVGNQYLFGNSNNQNNHSSSRRSHAAQSTISRFACRIIVEREPPYTARIYAAGFDSSKNIFLGEKATKWEQNNSIDGLTTNGILLMHPKRGYFCDNFLQSGENDEQMNIDEGNENNNGDYRESSSQLQDKAAGNSSNSTVHRFSTGENFEYGGVWREVSVDGGIYAIRESRSAIQKGKRIENETNILQDGTLIDLCGATLLWRSVDGFKSSPTKKTLEEKIDLLNASRPQCPVGLNTLVIPRKPIIPGQGERPHKRSSNQHQHLRNKDLQHSSHNSKSSERGGSGQQPYVYLKCGHVQGYHDWGTTAKADERTCPICLSVGQVAKLSMGLEPSFYVDSGPLTHVFNPCGHMASERTIKYWTSINIPYGTHFFHSICPFCASPLATQGPSSTRLIFQEDLD